MSGADFLADTNALIYLLNGNYCMHSFLQSNLAYSIISEIELLSLSRITATEENSIKSLLLDCQEISLTHQTKEKTIEIRKKYKIKLPDAIIAASAIIHNLPLISADKAFIQIQELCLKLIVPVAI